MSLQQTLGQPPVRAQVVAACVELVDAQVKKHGFMIKGAYATVKAIKKGFVADVINALLGEWLAELQPFYDQWVATDKTVAFAAFVVARKSEVAAALLAVTDRRAAKTSHGVAKSAYSKLRPSALQHVTEAVPELAAIVQRFMP
ncbi:MAG: hypothetical protein IPL79_17925 [Myxococcales bacterium]|nr:hypothetical protein [Myxococcales bacterium]